MSLSAALCPLSASPTPSPRKVLLSVCDAAGWQVMLPQLSCWRFAAQLVLGFLCLTGVAKAQFTFNSATGTITGYTGAGGAVVIPASIDGKPVTAIGDNAFSGVSSLTSVIIPASVTRIGGGAFQGCTGLTSVTIPNSVTSIGSYAFYDCRGLANITFKGNPPSLGNDVFHGVATSAAVFYPSTATCWGASYGGLMTVEDYLDVLTYSTANNQVTITGYTGTGGAVVIPASIGGAPVTAIGSSAFENRSRLTSVTIPDSVTSIGGNAFAFCDGLTRAIIPVALVPSSDAFPSTTTILRYLSNAQLASRDSQQNAAGRVLGQADVKNAPNTYGLYNLSQVQALNVDAPLLTREAGNNKFKLTMKVKKSTNLKTFTSLPFVSGDSTINSNGEMEFQFTSTENAAFYRIETH
ncbi:MAG: leucine-rich repeat domain-containing protein [Verrucomicrobiota bacterium]